MRLSSITVFCTIALTQANPGKINVRELKPADAGAYHTLGFEKLGELYKTKKPADKVEVALDASRIAASFCQEDDHFCQSEAYKGVLTQFQTQDEPIEINYPADFDERIISSLGEAMVLVAEYDGVNIESMLEELTNIQSQIENLDDVNEGYRVAGLASLSVGIESAKLWDNVVKDKEHPLHDMLGYFLEEGDRRLQDDSFFAAPVMLIDLEAAVNAAINAIDEDILILAVWPNIILKIIPDSYAASVQAAFGTGPPPYDPHQMPFSPIKPATPVKPPFPMPPILDEPGPEPMPPILEEPVPEPPILEEPVPEPPILEEPVPEPPLGGGD